MKEHHILFTPGNVRLILDGHKTQTRRIIKLPAAPNHLGMWEPTTVGGPDGGKTKRGETLPEMLAIWHTRTGATICCPWSVGDRLWVREGLARSKNLIGVIYRSDGEPVGPIPTGGWYRWEWQRDTLSPIHMPKWAARLWLEITEVRVQRLQEISEEDAIAEGVRPMSGQFAGAFVCPPAMSGTSARECYLRLWESINGPGSWERNPWVWAITFRRVGE